MTIFSAIILYIKTSSSMKHLILTILSIVTFATCASAQLTEQQQIQKLNLVYQHLRNHYVDDVSLEPLVDEAIKATLKELDPHSQYLTREEMEQFRAGLQGEFAGVGIRYIMHNDTLVVRSVIPNSPASRAGIIPNDRIVSVDNNNIVEIDIESAQKLYILFCIAHDGRHVTRSVRNSGSITEIDYILAWQKGHKFLYGRKSAKSTVKNAYCVIFHILSSERAKAISLSARSLPSIPL